MSSKETETNGKTDLSLEEKVDLLLQKVDWIIKKIKSDDEEFETLDEGPKDPPPTPPNP